MDRLGVVRIRPNPSSYYRAHGSESRSLGNGWTIAGLRPTSSQKSEILATKTTGSLTVSLLYCLLRSG
jgi:hypothetical protein